MKKIHSTYSLFSILLLTCILHIASSGGRNDTRAGAPGDSGTCSGCHFTAGSGDISLEGAPTSYELGQSYNMTLKVTDATASVGGFQIVATDGITGNNVGTFTPGTGTRVVGATGRLVQSGSKSFTSGEVTWDIDWTAPSSGAPDNVRFYFAGIGANGNGGNGSGDSGYNSTSAPIALPVSWDDVSIYKRGQNIVIKWSTQTEINNSHFEIEKYGSNGWLKVKEVKSTAIDHNGNEYEVEISEGLSKMNTFRIKQVDLDGTFSYSKVMNIERSNTDITVGPNPFVDYINVVSESQLDIEIFDVRGNKVLATNSFEINTSNLESGLYFLVGQDENGNIVFRQKMLKQ